MSFLLRLVRLPIALGPVLLLSACQNPPTPKLAFPAPYVPPQPASAPRPVAHARARKPGPCVAVASLSTERKEVLFQQFEAEQAMNIKIADAAPRPTAPAGCRQAER